MAEKNEKARLTINRIYEAPVEKVWQAWTDPAKQAQWWGPRGFTITTLSKDLRAGGHWKYIMHGPDGTDYPNHTLYYEVEVGKRLVYDHGGNENQPPLFRVEVTFQELAKNRTHMSMTMIFASVEIAKNMKGFVKEARGNSTWDRLGEYLAEDVHQQSKFIIHRTFDAPIEKVFKAWTEPDQFTQWLPPTGFDMKFQGSIKVQPGTSAIYSMSSKDFKMYGRIEYLEISNPSHMIYINTFCKEDGSSARHPLLPTWPEKMKTTVMFESEEQDVTRITIEWQPIEPVTIDELKAFKDHRSSMTEGWTGSFIKLEKLLDVDSF